MPSPIPAVLAVLGVAALTGCTARPKRDTSGAPANQSTDTAVRTNPGGTTRAPSSQPTDSQTAGPAQSAGMSVGVTAPAELAGHWTMQAENRTGRVPQMELEIDSVAGSSFRVRVAFMMRGDVGIDPAAIEPTRGETDSSGLLHFTVKFRAQPSPVGRITGAFSGDTIRVREYEWAGENQLVSGTSWIFVRQR